MLLQGDITEEEFEKKLNRRVYQNLTEEDQPVWTFAVLDKPEEMQNVVEKLRKYYLYGIRLGYRTIITEKKLKTFPKKNFNIQYTWKIEFRQHCVVQKQN